MIIRRPTPTTNKLGCRFETYCDPDNNRSFIFKVEKPGMWKIITDIDTNSFMTKKGILWPLKTGKQAC